MLTFKKSTSILGDSLQLLRKIPTGTFDHCIADPPYNMSRKKGLAWAFSKHVTMQENWDRFPKEDYVQFSFQWIAEICRVVKPNGNIFVFGSFHNIYTLGMVLEQLDRRTINSIIWFKPNAQPNITCRTLTESTEQIIWACNETKRKAAKWTFHYPLAKTMNQGKQLRNLWSIPVTPRKERVAGHPSQKPESLMERLVLLFSNPGDWILDPFAGVGTTGIACAKHQRHSVLIENQLRYFKAQQDRFQAAGLKSGYRFIKIKSGKESGAKTAAKPVVPALETLIPAN